MPDLNLKPKAWMHVMDNTEGIKGNKPHVVITTAKRNPFGRPGVDYSKSFPVTAEPLFTANQLQDAIAADRARRDVIPAQAGTSIDTPEFRALLDECYEIIKGGQMSEALEYFEGQLIAHIDAYAARRATPMAPMCERKTNDIMQRDGYEKTGYVLKKAGERICVSDGGAVSWFTPDQWQWLMFNRDHVEFDWPKPFGARRAASTDAVAVQYRMLTRADRIEADDEFLADDCVSWATDPNRIFVGMEYGPGALRPARRRVAPILPPQEKA